jgi:hypothetical protein
MPSRKRLVLFGLLALSIAAAAWVTEFPVNASDDIIALVAERPAATHKEAVKLPVDDKPALSMDKLQRPQMEVGDLNPFGAKSWYVPPPPPPPEPLPKPTAPPLPFTYVGKLQEDDGHWVIYLVKGDQSYAVSKGETFDSVYRLEGIENGNLVIQYLPLSIKQILAIGSES